MSKLDFIWTKACATAPFFFYMDTPPQPPGHRFAQNQHTQNAQTV